MFPNGKSTATQLKTQTVDCPLCHSSEGTFVAEGKDFEYHTSDDAFQVIECNTCGVMRLNPRPSLTELSRIYPPEYLPYQFQTHLKPWTRLARNYFLRKRVKTIRRLVRDSASILEVGCGDGEFLLLLKNFGPSGWHLAGNDISLISKSRLGAANIPLYVMRFEELQENAGQWDIIIMKDVIEHLDDPDALLQKAYAMLRSGGYLLLETPNTGGWDCRLFRKRYWGGWHFPRHWTLYSMTSIKKHLQAKNFQAVTLQPTLSPNFWAQSVHHWCSEWPFFSLFAPFFDARNALPMVFFSLLDMAQMALTHQTSNMRVIARKPPDEINQGRT